MHGHSGESGRGDCLCPTDPRLLANPLVFIHEDHLRERAICAMLDRIAGAGSPSPDEAAHAAGFLSEELPRHLADEEEDLFPLLRRRCAPEDDIGRALARLTDDHRRSEADTPEVIALLRGLGHGSAVLPDGGGDVLTRYAGHARRHLILENAVILPLARARLTGRDLDGLRRAMRRRRGLDNPKEAADAR